MRILYTSPTCGERVNSTVTAERSMHRSLKIHWLAIWEHFGAFAVYFQSIFMYILIVNGFADSGKGNHEYGIFKELVLRVLKECEVPDCYFLERRLNRLGDLVVDWEHDSLNDESRENCKHFDKIDFVFISGDMKICPWEPMASQVVTLIHMCKFMKKPIFCSGFGAFSAIYTLATKGARFHILNGPNGGDIEHLPTYPRYSIGTGAFPSGWLDNETGDLYTYNRKHESWEPVCNLGIYRLAANGTPSSNRHAPLAKRYARDDHTLDFNQIIEPLDEDATVTRIRSIHLQHHSVLKFEAQNFISKAYLNWYIKSDGSLPAGENLHVIADSEKGAIVLSKENMLMLSCRIDKSISYKSCMQIMKNFVNFIMEQIREANRDKLEDSMLTFLFGADGVSGGTYDSTHAKMNMSAPLARSLVRTALPEGPVKVDPPVIGMFLYTPKQDNVDYLALTAARRSSTIGRAPKIRVQNPLFARQKRLELLSAVVGDTRDIKEVARESLSQSQKMNAGDDLEGAPEQVKELFTGIIMNSRSISTRRTRSPSPLREASPSLSDAPSPPPTDFDKEDENYELDEHIQPFGEALVIPGTDGSRKIKSTSGTFEYLNRDLNTSLDKMNLLSKSIDSVKGASVVHFEEPELGTASVITAVTINNVPFQSISTSQEDKVEFVPAHFTAPSSVAPSVFPQQPASPRSTASASRLASQINREYRQRAQQDAVAIGIPPGSLAAVVTVNPSTEAAANDDSDSSDDERTGQAPMGAQHAHPSISLLSGGSVGGGVSGWSHSVDAHKVPPIMNWSKVNQGKTQQTHTSKSARPFTQASPFGTVVADSQDSYSDRPKYNQYGSLIVESQAPHYNHNLFAPTKSSLHRSSLSSSMGVHREVLSPRPPLPQSARTASEIESTLRKLYIPVKRPPGPATQKKPPHSGHGHGDDDHTCTSEQDHSFMRLFTTHSVDGHHESMSDFSHQSDAHQQNQYQDPAVPQVLLPTTPSIHRPYSSYQKITRQLQEKKQAESHARYEGAYADQYTTVEEQHRKDYMKKKEKFIAGPFKTCFGQANSAMQIRKDGIIGADGPYPLEPAMAASLMPENTTAVHFAGMARAPRVPLLAGNWK